MDFLISKAYEIKRFEPAKMAPAPAPLLLVHGAGKNDARALVSLLKLRDACLIGFWPKPVRGKNFTLLPFDAAARNTSGIFPFTNADTVYGACVKDPQSSAPQVCDFFAHLADSLIAHPRDVLTLRIEDSYETAPIGHKLLCCLMLKKRHVIYAGRRLNLFEGNKGKPDANTVARMLRDCFSDAALESAHTNSLLSCEIQKNLRRFKPGQPCISDVIVGSLPARKFHIAIKIMAHKFTALNADEKRVGLLLPNSIGLGVAFLALSSIGRVPALLNYASGASLIIEAARLAGLKTILTSRRFVEKAKLEDVIAALVQNFRILYLEDVRASVSKGDMARALLRSAKSLPASPDDEAVILFTSGSESRPKGVALSHRNILSNLAQISARLDMAHDDHLLNPLPMFHSFGLTAGFLFPLISGIRLTLYPSPLHYKEIPELIAQQNITILLGTDTFLRGYARTAKADDFKTLRFAVAGAEALKDDTRAIYEERFKTSLHEGYGLTETSPVLCVNTPLFNKTGTVGRLFPGIEYRLEPVEGLNLGQRLLVRGPNIMLGYLDATGGCAYQKPAGGWHDTGDIVTIDEDGYVSIKGRLKRFAKIAGEMVSLTSVEACVSAFNREELFAAIALTDSGKGEKIVLATTLKSATREDIRTFMRAQNAPPLALPAQVMAVEAMPLLASGKIDYATLQSHVKAILD